MFNFKKDKIHTCGLDLGVVYAHTQTNPILTVMSPIVMIGYYLVMRFNGLGVFDNFLYLFLFIFIFLVISFFSILTVVVDNEKMVINFLCPKCKKYFYFKDIKGVKKVRNKWWYGWGVRILPGFVIFNTYGLDAIELEMKKGLNFRIGTDQPEILEKIIKKQLSKK